MNQADTCFLEEQSESDGIKEGLLKVLWYCNSSCESAQPRSCRSEAWCNLRDRSRNVEETEIIMVVEVWDLSQESADSPNSPCLNWSVGAPCLRKAWEKVTTTHTRMHARARARGHISHSLLQCGWAIIEFIFILRFIIADVANRHVSPGRGVN